MTEYQVQIDRRELEATLRRLQEARNEKERQVANADLLKTVAKGLNASVLVPGAPRESEVQSSIHKATDSPRRVDNLGAAHKQAGAIVDATALLAVVSTIVGKWATTASMGAANELTKCCNKIIDKCSSWVESHAQQKIENQAARLEAFAKRTERLKQLERQRLERERQKKLEMERIMQSRKIK